jgi:hypothetical protein
MMGSTEFHFNQGNNRNHTQQGSLDIPQSHRRTGTYAGRRVKTLNESGMCRQISVKISNKKVNKNRSAVLDLLHADGWSNFRKRSA